MTATQAEIDSAVRAAVAEKDAKIAKLEAEAASSQVDTKVSEAVAAKDAEITELQKKLDAAELTAQAETKKREDAEAAALETARLADEAKLVASRVDSRKADVKALGLPFTAAQVDEKAPRWATLSDADWKIQVDEFVELAKVVVPTGLTLGAAREFDALQHRQDPAGNGTGSATASVRALALLADAGIDPRRIRS